MIEIERAVRPIRNGNHVVWQLNESFFLPLWWFEIKWMYFLTLNVDDEIVPYLFYRFLYNRKLILLHLKSKMKSYLLWHDIAVICNDSL